MFWRIAILQAPAQLRNPNAYGINVRDVVRVYPP